MIKKCYVYKITNNILNKSYIGSRVSYDPEKDTKYMGSSNTLYKEYVKYGIENFNKIIIKIYENIDKKELLDNESHYIKYYNTLMPNGYNKNLPNNHLKFYFTGEKLSDEQKDKISSGLKLAYKEGRKKVKDYSGKNHPMFGKHHTDETKEKIGTFNKGKTQSIESNDKRSKSLTGVKKTELHALHISEGRKGIIFSDDHKQNISKSKKGKSLVYSEKGKEIRSNITKKLNSIRIKCEYCNKEFNPGNYARHIKTKHSSF